MLFKIIPLGALASTFTREDGEVMSGATGEQPPLRALLLPRAVPGSAGICSNDTAIMGRTARQSSGGFLTPARVACVTLQAPRASPSWTRSTLRERPAPARQRHVAFSHVVGARVVVLRSVS